MLHLRNSAVAHQVQRGLPVTSFRPSTCQTPSCRLQRCKLLLVSAAPQTSKARPVGPGPSGAPDADSSSRRKKSKKHVQMNGSVLKDMGNGMFQVKLENGVTMLAHLSGKIRLNKVKVMVGDFVEVELSPYDLTKGRIAYRTRPGAGAGAKKPAGGK